MTKVRLTPAKRLKKLRTKNALTQAQLGRLSSLDVSSISAMENGREPIGKIRAERLAKALKVKPWEILY